jgi:choline monooxygenase
MQLDIHEDIRRASTLPGAFYSDPEVHRLLRDRVFAKSWQLVADADRLRAPGQTLPVTLLEGMVDEPLLLTRGADDRLHCLSNVCTHRGNLVAEAEGVRTQLRCRYHGRRFGLDGRCLSMPEFEGVEGFPSKADDLPPVALSAWGKFLFASLDPSVALGQVIAPMKARLAWLDHAPLALDAGRSRDYLVRANWALYVDNYLEGFHVPYVHGSLADALDYGSYRTELFPLASLQLGVARSGEEAFALPETSPDRGERIAAYYFWFFPNTMFNVYPWGISVNVVQPLAVDRTKVSFSAYVAEPSRLDRGAGADLDRVEREDEVIVEAVQRGIRSRLYRRGRYSPAREQGVHHFHRLLAAYLAA